MKMNHFNFVRAIFILCHKEKLNEEVNGIRLREYGCHISYSKDVNYEMNNIGN